MKETNIQVSESKRCVRCVGLKAWGSLLWVQTGLRVSQCWLSERDGFFFLTRKDLHGNLLYAAWLLYSEAAKYESISNHLIYSSREIDIRHAGRQLFPQELMFYKLILAVNPPYACVLHESTLWVTDNSESQNSFCTESKKKKLKKGKNIYFVTIFNFHFKEKFIKIY